MIMSGSSAIVTGGASGLGGATSALLASRGMKVAIFDLNEELGRTLATKIGGSFHRVDVTDEISARAALDEAARSNGKARLLVNCAGTGLPQRVLDRHGQPQPLANFVKVVGTNLFGTFNLIANFASRLQSAQPLGEERGVIINTASIAAFDGQIGQAAYAASKSGIVGMTLPIARELARHAIRVVTIAPGLFLTPLLETLPQEVRDSLAAQVPFPPRLGHPAEYAAMVVHIIENTMLNGETIRLDGALRMAGK
jgi:NAD(P)-dependent dehydrogenase (short-subunit alcohol dehydrogenase family)